MARKSDASGARATDGHTFSRSTGRRITDRLLSSGGKLALVGLANSLATLAFTVWLQALVRHQIEVGEPLARSAIELQTALAQSFSDLRSWVAWGHPDAPRDRRAVWADRIQPQLDILRSAAAASHRAVDVEDDVRELEAMLRRLKYLQWTVEDIAWTPSDRPAEAAYEERLRPLRNSVLEALTPPSRSEPREGPLFGDVLRLSKAFLETDRALFEVLRDYTPAEDAQVQRLVQELETQGDQVEARLAEARVEAQRSRLRFILREARAYAQQAQKALAKRRGADANVSRTLFTTELQPLQAEIEEVAHRVARKQITFVQRQGRGLFRLSFVVLGLALLTGLLSVVSLYVSHRLEFRVKNALAQAKSLGQYEVGERIGCGAMGEVYEARHALLRRPSAIKILRVDIMRDPRAQERFRKEVQMTSLLNHPNTIAIFDYGRTPEGMFYYAMELLNGVPLDTLVAVCGPLVPGRVVHVLRQVCASLHEAHAKGLLHRDIKPSNVMIAELGGVFDTVKVVDFGLVARVSGPDAETTGGSELVGTPMYLAPETIRSADAASPASDIYAIGAVGYFLLTGTTLFLSDDVNDVLRSHLEEPPEPPSERLGASLPADLEMLVLACLAKDPSDRPESAARLKSMLLELSVSAWTPEDAELWWAEYGEAVRSEARFRSTVRQSSRNRASIKVVPTPRA